MSSVATGLSSLSSPPVPQAPAPATAVEVVTSLGGSIISVDTLTLAQASRRRGWGCLAAGAALLVMALATFVYGVSIARADAAARERWIAEKKPSWAFRPTRHGAVADGVALVGAVAGLALVAAGLVRRRGAERTRLRVGQNDGVDIPLADAPPERTLVDRDASGGFVAPIDGLDGDVAFAGTATTLASMRAAGHVALPLYVGTQLRTRIGHASFFVRGMVAPARTAPPAMGWDRRVLAFVAASAVVHLGVWGFLRTVPPDMMGAPADHSIDEQSSVRAVTTSREDEVPPPPEDGDADSSGSEGMSSPTAVALDDGTLGERDPNPTPARLRVMDRGLTPQMARERAIAQAAEAGILGSTIFTGPISVADAGSIASGFDDMDITGGFYDGGGQGAPAGSFGWGVRGTGTGCGTIAGVNCRGIASDPFATSGNDGTDWNGPIGGPGGPGRDKTRVAAVPTAKLLEPTTCGPNSASEDCLDRAMIRRYVKRHLEKIRYCYEKELLVQPGLEGTVTALFTINGNGVVVDSKASGVDANVSGCIAQVVSNISFPKIGNGTGAYPIKYPFQLQPRGGR